VGWSVIVLWRFDLVAYGVLASECYFDVCVSEQVCVFSYVRGNVGECCPFIVFVHICMGCGVFCLMLYLVS